MSAQSPPCQPHDVPEAIAQPEVSLQRPPQPTVNADSPHLANRIGVIGGGQLAWMMLGAAHELNVELAVQTPQDTDPAVAQSFQTTPHWSPVTRRVIARLDDPAATAQLAQQCDVITFENEFVNLEGLTALAQQGICFRPPLEALVPLLDKYHQRCFLHQLGLPVPQFAAIANLQSEETLPTFDWPLVLKTRRHGYDGQGTVIVHNARELLTARQRLGDRPLIMEEFIPFEQELAVMAARSVRGDIALYPVAETQQQGQVCRRVIVPAALDSEVVSEIQAIAHRLLTALNAVGIFGIEFFLTPSGQIYVNEVSPRPHNSGHYSLDACQTSQFSQHLRAVSGRPLGDPSLVCGGAVMVNLLGFEVADHDYRQKRQQLADLPNAHLYWYGKSPARPGRKLGHITVLIPPQSPTIQREQALAIARNIETLWYGFPEKS